MQILLNSDLHLQFAEGYLSKYLGYILYQVGLYLNILTDRRANSVDLDQLPQNALSDQGLDCLLLTQQFQAHQQVVKWTFNFQDKYGAALFVINPKSAENDICCLGGICQL